MKKHLFLLLFALLVMLPTAFAYDFSAVAPSGQTLYYNIVNGEAEVTSQNSSNPYYSTYPTGTLSIPSDITYSGTTYAVTSIGQNAFRSCSGLTSVTIPSSVTSISNYAFYGCTGLTSVTNGSGVISIGYYAFQNCTGLTTIAIPNGVTSIASSAFRGCSGLTSVSIGNNVTSIGTNAFYGCSGLTSVTIPNSVTSIDSYVFSRCTGLTSITIPSSVTFIGNYAFQNCSSLTTVNYTGTIAQWCNIDFYGALSNPIYYSNSLKINFVPISDLVIPDGVTTIKQYTFDGCSGLTSVTIPNSVTSIGTNAFYDCSGLTSVNYTGTIAQWCNIDFSSASSNPTYYAHSLNINGNSITNLIIPDGVTTIKQHAFYNCTGLTSVTIPNSVTMIGNSAFYHCTGLTSVTIPSSVTSIESNAFSNVRHIEYYGNATGSPWGAFSLNGVVEGDFVYSDNTKHKILAYIGTGGAVTIPSTVDTIGNKAFYGCRGLTSIDIPSSITTISNYAFQGCSGLTSVNIPSSITYIGGYGFADCSSMTSITIPASVTTIFLDAFQGCSGLTTVNYTGSIAQWCNIDFSSASSNPIYYAHSLNINGNPVIHLIIPDGVTTIKQYAFYNCFAFISIDIPSSVTTIGDAAFSNVRHIEYYGHATGSPWGAISMNSVVEGDFVYSDNTKHILLAYIGTGGAVNIPSTVNTIGNKAFYGCSGLTSVTIPNSVTSIGQYAFCGCISLPSVTIPNSVGTISNYAFRDCSGLTSVTIPNGVTSIGSSAFQGCSSLTSITIPNSVTSIGSLAFYGCTNLTEMYIKRATPPTLGNASSISEGNINVVVPHNSYSAYLNAGTNYTRHYLYRDSIFISHNVNDTIRGYVMGDNISLPYPYTDTLRFLAIPHYGYHLTRWDNNSTDSIRLVTHINQSDTIVTAFFDINQYAVRLAVDTNIHGSCIGAGSYDYLSNCTIQTNANYGYHFTQWNDGVTDNPRTFTLTQDTSFTAQFANNIYNIIVLSGDTVMGSVAGAESVEYLELTAITAIPNYGYIFTQWSDGNTNNPRVVQVTRDSVFTAQFDYNQYNITLYTDTSIHGNCTGSGSYNYLSNRTIQANANYGYHFTQWNDGVTDNPRTFTLTQDTVFTAYYANNQYSVIGQTTDSIKGVVVGSATVDYLDSVTLEAIPHYGYHFVRWNDNNTDNPRTLIATGNISKTAIFAYNQYLITLGVDTSIHGNCTGSGSYNYLSNRTIQANANYGYHFTQWNDGVTDNPRTFTLTRDTTFTAFYAPNQYSVTGRVDSSAMGTVTGSDTVNYLDTVVLTATANYGYHFAHWNDNNTDNPRTVVATDNISLTAIFDYNSYTITLSVDANIHGTVSGEGTYIYLAERTITATPNYGYHFTHWQDGDTNNPRTITLTRDTSFTAFFAPNQYTLTVIAGEHGTVSEGGVYDYGDTVTIEAFPEPHYHLVRWDDGNTDNPRQYIITEDDTITALFAIDTHTVVVESNDILRGIVEASGTEFVYGTPCTVTATPYSGYIFVGWSDGTNYNPYVFAVVSDTTLIARFLTEEEYEGIDDVIAIDVQIYQHNGQIVVEGAEGNTVMLYDVNGRILATKRDDYTPLRFDVPASGTYMIKIGDYPARKVVVVR